MMVESKPRIIIAFNSRTGHFESEQPAPSGDRYD